MPVQRTGGVEFEGSSPLGTPSPSPDVRTDAQAFNVPFDRDKFTNAIKRHGYDVIWEKATPCPFLKGPSPKDHDINCQMCHGGYYYFDAQPTKMLIQSLNISQQYFAYGRFDSGKASITAFPEFKVSFWDSITICKSRTRYAEYARRQRNGLVDNLKFAPICVEYVVWNNAGAVAVAKQDIDFTLTAGACTITWISANRPQADTYYSVMYYYRPRYIVLDVPHNVRDVETPIPVGGASDTQLEFPVQVIGQLDQFVRSEGRDPSDEGDTKNPFPISGSPFSPSA